MFYLEEPPPGPLYGGYSFPLPARTISKMTGHPYNWIDVRADVFVPLESAGYAGNVWPTWLRDLVVDFGYLGAIVFCALFGGFMAWTRNRYELTGALHYHYLEVLAAFTLAFGAFQNNLWNPLLSAAFFIAIAVMFVTRAQLAKPRPAPAAPQTVRA